MRSNSRRYPTDFNFCALLASRPVGSHSMKPPKTYYPSSSLLFKRRSQRFLFRTDRAIAASATTDGQAHLIGYTGTRIRNQPSYLRLPPLSLVSRHIQIQSNVLNSWRNHNLWARNMSYRALHRSPLHAPPPLLPELYSRSFVSIRGHFLRSLCLFAAIPFPYPSA
jgi:hypothetical protein